MQFEVLECRPLEQVGSRAVNTLVGAVGGKQAFTQVLLFFAALLGLLPGVVQVGVSCIFVRVVHLNSLLIYIY